MEQGDRLCIPSLAVNLHSCGDNKLYLATKHSFQKLRHVQNLNCTITRCTKISCNDKSITTEFEENKTTR